MGDLLDILGVTWWFLLFLLGVMAMVLPFLVEMPIRLSIPVLAGGLLACVIGSAIGLGRVQK